MPASSALVPVALVLAVLGAFAIVLWRSAPPAMPEFDEDVHVLPVPLEIPAFALVDHRGAVFDRGTLEERWSLLFFGYTYCPDICPITLARLAPVQDRLGSDADTRVVFVSVDPGRDDVARMSEYVAFFHSTLVGVTGPPDQIAALTGAVGAYNALQAPEPDADGYLVDHATSLFLVGPDARLHAILHEPDDPAAFVALLRRIQALDRSAS